MKEFTIDQIERAWIYHGFTFRSEAAAYLRHQKEKERRKIRRREKINKFVKHLKIKL